MLAIAISSLTLINLTDKPLRAVAVPIPAGRLYEALEVDFGRPLRFVGPDGRELPCQLDKEAGAVWVLCDLPAGGKAEVEVSPAKEWPQLLKVKARWDAKAGKGELTNGIITARLDGMAASIVLPDGRSFIEGLHFYGWLLERPVHVPSPKWAWEKGLPSLSTSEFDSLEVKIKSEGPVRAQILLTKVPKGKGKGKVAYHESISLHPTQPVVEYRLEVENLTEKPLWIADCDGVIHAR